jgi:hypothetical protein
MGEFVQRQFASHPEGEARQNIMIDFQRAFGVQGSRVATLLSSPMAIEQFRQIGESFGQAGGVEGMQKRFADESVAQQWMNAKTNFVSAMTELGMTLLPMASKALKALNRELQGVIGWIMKHQEATKTLAKSFLILSGAMMFTGTVLMLTAAFRGLALAMSFSAVGAFAPLIKLSSALTAASAAPGLALVGALIGRLVGLALIPAAGIGLGMAFDKLFPNNWLARFGRWSGDTAFNLTHDDYDPNAHPWIRQKESNGDGKSSASPSKYVSPAAQAKVTVHVHNKIDKNGIATMVTQEQTKSVLRPQTAISGFDDVAGLTPAGGLGY